MDRQEGYYWVKYGVRFIIAEWDGELWYTTEYLEPMEDISFGFINENRIKSPGEIPD